ncbi:hypothetical protein HX024_18140 [Myroides marinus]|uniref:4-fold beta flower protein n=1 Tax=Myroides marinus TaxID=703342 RepID=UPI002577413F|nr:hypothetical protein [Myroides marinus]MDM1384583.1 hypothetical protein [Myroides marinus]
MEETLFNVDGTPQAYIVHNDDKTIYLWNGTPVAYLSDNSTIYGFNGKHLGWYEDGIVRNLNGKKNGFNKKSLPVYAKYEPYKSYKKYKPYKSYKQYSKYKPYYKISKSDISLEIFLNQGKK